MHELTRAAEVLICTCSLLPAVLPYPLRKSAKSITASSLSLLCTAVSILLMQFFFRNEYYILWIPAFSSIFLLFFQLLLPLSSSKSSKTILSSLQLILLWSAIAQCLTSVHSNFSLPWSCALCGGVLLLFFRPVFSPLNLSLTFAAVRANLLLNFLFCLGAPYLALKAESSRAFVTSASACIVLLFFETVLGMMSLAKSDLAAQHRRNETLLSQISFCLKENMRLRKVLHDASEILTGISHSSSKPERFNEKQIEKLNALLTQANPVPEEDFPLLQNLILRFSQEHPNCPVRFIVHLNTCSLKEELLFCSILSCLLQNKLDQQNNPLLIRIFQDETGSTLITNLQPKNHRQSLELAGLLKTKNGDLLEIDSLLTIHFPRFTN